MKVKYAAWIIGTGIMLMAVHTPLLTLTDKEGVTWLFLPQIGLMCSLMLTLVYVAMSYKKLTLGSKFIWIPLAVISMSIIISVVWQYFGGNMDLWDMASKALFGVFLFALYVASRNMGQELFKPFTVAVIVVAVSCVVYGIINPGVKTGGLASPTNYDMATGLLILGTVVSVVKKQWWLWAITLIGLAFTGADEAIFTVVVLIISLIIRRDWSKKILLPIGLVVIVAIIGLSTGIVQKLYQPTIDKVTSFTSAVKGEGNTDELMDVATGYRWTTYWKLSPIKPFGYGYNINDFYEGIPHNVVLIAIEQVGIVGALAWVFVTLFCLVKTKWKYAFIAILALSIFDHFLWTQIAPFWWCLIGVTSASKMESDLIFKNKKLEVLECQSISSVVESAEKKPLRSC